MEKARSGGDNPFRNDILFFAPRDIRGLTGVMSLSYVVILIALYFSGDEVRLWLAINEITFITFGIVSGYFFLFANRQQINFYLYISFSLFVTSLNFLAFGLVSLGIVNLSSFIVTSVMYLTLLVTAYSTRSKFLVHKSGSKKIVVTFSLGASSIGTSIGLILSRVLPTKMGLMIAGMIFTILGYLMAFIAFYITYKWYLAIKGIINPKSNL